MAGVKLLSLAMILLAGLTVEAEPPKDGNAPPRPRKLARQPPPNRCPPEMAYLPAGAFKMTDRGDQVKVTAFCLDLTEVTVVAYAACQSCSAADTGGNCNAGLSERGHHPINCVNWAQADAYCRALGKRLPTEEEWEWAARGGEEGRKFPWGSAEPGAQVCWDGPGNELGRAKRRSTCPVGSYSAGDSLHGIHDLAGNVWEWTASDYGSPPDRVCRSGAWEDQMPVLLKAAIRVGFTPNSVSGSIGFRCARSP